jgi:hypothetical protein
VATACRLMLVSLMVGCGASGPSALTQVPRGTWGGDDSGLIVSATEIHAHIGCTKGDLPGSIPLDGHGRFDVEGLYNVDAYPVDRGILHPARFFGSTDGHALTLSVRLTDTGQTLGPVSLTFGREPGMSVCPICRVPPRR